MTSLQTPWDKVSKMSTTPGDQLVNDCNCSVDQDYNRDWQSHVIFENSLSKHVLLAGCKGAGSKQKQTDTTAGRQAREAVIAAQTKQTAEKFFEIC